MSDNPYQKPAQSSGYVREERRIVITDIDVPFMRAVMILLKWMIASIPATIIMFVVITIVMAVIGAIFGGAVFALGGR